MEFRAHHEWMKAGLIEFVQDPHTKQIEMKFGASCLDTPKFGVRGTAEEIEKIITHMKAAFEKFQSDLGVKFYARKL